MLNDSEESYLIFDDSVQDKRYSTKTCLTKRQYSGNEHGLVRGIGVVNLVRRSGIDFYPIDFRIYAPDTDGTTKNEHFREMYRVATQVKKLLARIVVFDSWYASLENLKLIHGDGRVFRNLPEI